MNGQNVFIYIYICSLIATYCARWKTALRVGGSCCVRFETGHPLRQQHTKFVFFLDR